MATKIPPAEAPCERNLADRKACYRRTVFSAASGAGNFRIAKLPAKRQARSGAAALAQHATQQLGCIAQRQPFHDAGAIAFDCSRAQAELARDFLVGLAERDLSQHFALHLADRGTS